LRFLPRGLEVNRNGSPTFLAAIPKLAEPLQVFLAQFALELPIPDCLAHNLAGGGVFACLDGSLE
jgi:hypothetical protein